MRFAPPTARARLAVLAGFAHPDARHTGLYELVDRVADALAGDAIFLHSTVGDPAGLPTALRARVGSGLLAPCDPDLHANDVAHFERTAPERLQAFLAALARHGGVPPAAVAARPEVREAISFARWAQGWAPSVVVSFGLEAGSFRAFAICSLLGLPRVTVLDDARYGDEYRNLLPLHVEQAHVVVATHAFVRDALVQRFSAAVLRKTVTWAAETGEVAELVAAIGRALGAGRDGDVPLGPAAAFATAPVAPARPAGSQPFVVLGAERTGSNMLMAMLAAQPRFGCANELFNPRAIAADELSYLPGAPTPAAELMALRRRDPAGLLARLGADAAAAGAAWHGCKLLYGHALVDDRVVDAFVGDPDLRVVHLLRRDRLGRWLSMVRALASDSWFGGERAGDQQVVLPVQQTASDFAFHEVMEARYRAVFAGHRALELDYDDLAADVVGSARRLGDFFGVDLGALAPRTHKTGPASVGRAIANLEELRWAFAGTRWAGLIA